MCEVHVTTAVQFRFQHAQLKHALEGAFLFVNNSHFKSILLAAKNERQGENMIRYGAMRFIEAGSLHLLRCCCRRHHYYTQN
jgi:hypothetical protein